MVKEITDDQIDFTDLASIKTPEQREALSNAAEGALESLKALDKPADDFVDLTEKLEDPAGKEVEKPKDAPAVEKLVEKVEKPAADAPAADKDKPEVDAPPVDDDLKTLAPDAQKLVMAERQKVKDAVAAADAKVAEAKTETETVKVESEGKRDETLRLSEVNQDKANFAQVLSVGKDVDTAIAKKEAELLAAKEEGDSKKEVLLIRELSKLDLSKQQVEEYVGKYVAKYGADDKGNVNFRPLEPEKKPDAKAEAPKVLEPSANQKLWGEKNASLIRSLNDKAIKDLGALSTAVEMTTGLNSDDPEHYEHLKVAAKSRLGIDLVGIKEGAEVKPEPKPEVKLVQKPSTVAGVDHAAHSTKSDDDVVIVTALQQEMHRKAGGNPNDPVWRKQMAETNKKVAAEAKARG